VFGPLLLLKLYLLDNWTMLRIMLDFSEDGHELLNFELDDEARANLVKIFTKFSRVIDQQLSINHNKHTIVTIKKFLDLVGGLNVKDLLINGLLGSSPDDQEEYNPTQKSKKRAYDLNHKYSQDIDKIAHVILLKYSFKNENNPQDSRRYLDLNFMQEKFKNNINVENVNKLMSFEKTTLDRATQFFTQTAGVTMASDMVKVQSRVSSIEHNVGKLEEVVRVYQSKLKQ